jgi:CRP-like cAMP-binding protein
MLMSSSNPLLSNKLLASLPAGTIETIGAELRRVDLVRGAVVYALGAQVDYLYFIIRGLASLVMTMSDGRMVEIGAIGPEGVTGVNALFDVDTAPFETVIQIPGEAYRIPVRKISGIMRRNPSVHDLMEGYVHVVLGQIAQTAACNRLHSTEERFCRWLLLSHDAARSDAFQLTHEFLAVMLGVHRVSVTHIAGEFQRMGIIRYHRGQMKILDRPALQRKACECYAAVQERAAQLLGSRTGS